MSPAWKTALIALAGVVAGAALSATISRPVNTENDAASFPRTADGRPDLSGLWQALTTANWNLEGHPAQAQPGPWLALGAIGAIPPGQGVVEGGEIPYRPEAAARRRANFEHRLEPATADPEAKCYLPGVPRATYLPFPFQIVQGTAKIAIAYGYADASRTIHMDKETRVPAPLDFWMGRSHGRWDGDTLVVDVDGLNGQSWLDRAGNFVSERVRIVERYTPRGKDHLTYQATIEDPSVFTRSWTIAFPLYRRLEQDVRFLDFDCVQYSECLLYRDFQPSTAP